MPTIFALVQQNSTAFGLAGLVLIAFGLWLSSRRPRNSASGRGVIVGGHSSGSINTGDTHYHAPGGSGVPPPRKPGPDWVAVGGLIVSALGVLVSALAWLFPHGA
jgi:LPXTG-motif cell wall-anchored protein